jgi:serine/threonine-protein kinase
LIKGLGKGACGETVLLRDETIAKNFVCKKYQPYSEAVRATLFVNFMREIDLLHELHHPNVVRVFNCYVYPEQFSGYILMEHIDGVDISSCVKAQPEIAPDLFRQAVEGFAYLEEAGVLHRDIRPHNILVRSDGLLKIIDLGFGKRIEHSADFDKSVSLNWWCEPPAEFTNGTYDFCTEVYFVGKLFEQLLVDNSLGEFPYSEILRRMCHRSRDGRVGSFAEVRRLIHARPVEDVSFADWETDAYRDFASSLTSQLTRLGRGIRYVSDLEAIRANLEELYRSNMLEESIHSVVAVARCFLSGTYYYRRDSHFPVEALRKFLELLRRNHIEKQRIVLSNLCGRFDAIPRQEPPSHEDIPF